MRSEELLNFVKECADYYNRYYNRPSSMSIEFSIEDANRSMRKVPEIKKVIFNDPATIIFWSDNTKTIVKAENETFDAEKGLAIAIAKKALGNEGNYYNEFKKHLGDAYETMRHKIDIFLKGVNLHD